MLERVIFSGSGGQGLMFIGKMFARMMMDKVEHLTFFPSYGSEVRGGTAHCQVVLSSRDIASPIVEEADALLLMNQPSVDRFLPVMAPGGLAIVNETLAHVPAGNDAVMVDATTLGQEAGNIRSANVALFGAFLSRKGLMGFDEAKDAIVRMSAAKGKRFEEINVRAFRAGWDAGQ
jgi:2-oxoglutarate ferredoxin oxidoreductase subunit gamma